MKRSVFRERRQRPAPTTPPISWDPGMITVTIPKNGNATM
jgi:hypothetical protein